MTIIELLSKHFSSCPKKIIVHNNDTGLSTYWEWLQPTKARGWGWCVDKEWDNYNHFMSENGNKEVSNWVFYNKEGTIKIDIGNKE